MHSSACTPRLISSAGRLLVHDFGGAGVAERPGAAHDETAVLVNLELGVLDAVVVFLRAVAEGRALTPVNR